jgi:tetratricopeptide (TPR) repeat protein
LEKVLAENPDVWQGYYNAACFEALTGNDDAAIDQLKRAIELDPQALEYAANDSDFDSLRDRPDFPS